MSVKVIETISLKIKNKNLKSRLGGVSKEGPLLLIQYHSCRQSFFPLLDLQRGCVNAIRNVSPQLSHSDTENIESHRRNTQLLLHLVTDIIKQTELGKEMYFHLFIYQSIKCT